MSRKKSKAGNGKYRSHFELEVSQIMPENSYECTQLAYTIPAVERQYIPDFTITATDGHTIHFECKGRFRTKAEADKYLYVVNSNPDIDLRFIIMDKKTMMPRSKTTMYDWLKKNGIKTYVWPNIPKIKQIK